MLRRAFLKYLPAPIAALLVGTAPVAASADAGGTPVTTTWAQYFDEIAAAAGVSIRARSFVGPAVEEARWKACVEDGTSPECLILWRVEVR